MFVCPTHAISKNMSNAKGKLSGSNDKYLSYHMPRITKDCRQKWMCLTNSILTYSLTYLTKSMPCTSISDSHPVFDNDDPSTCFVQCSDCCYRVHGVECRHTGLNDHDELKDV